jgi:hypothetical protein
VTGRWKAGSGDECYFDENDTGPDQCDPVAGRWENGSSSCEWNPAGSGENECEPPDAETVCYYQGEPDTCATEQELDDLSTLLAAAEADIELMEDQYESEYAEYEEWCDENPGQCDEEESLRSGPTSDDVFGCGAEAVAAVGAVAGAALTVVSFKSMVTAGLVTSVGGVLAAALVGGVVVGIAAIAVSSWWSCWRAIPRIPAAGRLPAEPAH